MGTRKLAREELARLEESVREQSLTHDTFVVTAFTNLNGISSWKEREMIELCQNRIGSLGFDVTDLKIDEWQKLAYFQVARRGQSRSPSHEAPSVIENPVPNNQGADRFWAVAPPGMSPQQIYDYGIMSYSRDDGINTIRAGWALWRTVGIGQLQASDFLNDGYRIWSESPWYRVDEALQFLAELFEGLENTRPAVPTDFWSRSPEEITPIADHYSRMCWAGCKLVILAEETNHPEVVAKYEDRCYEAVIGSPPDFVPPSWMAWARATAERRGDPSPWE